MSATPRNGDAQTALRRALDRQPSPETAVRDTDEPGEPIATYSGRHHVAATDADGNIVILRKGSRSTSDIVPRLSQGVDDPRPSELRKRLEKINTDNAAFWKNRTYEGES